MNANMRTEMTEIDNVTMLIPGLGEPNSKVHIIRRVTLALLLSAVALGATACLRNPGPGGSAAATSTAPSNASGTRPMPGPNYRDQIGLNFIRPDVGRPGNYDFMNSHDWIVSQYTKLGVKWNRLAFSWVLIQPQPDVYNWEVYDQIVDACAAAHIEILATLGGHFDNPAVPVWAGPSLKEIVNEHPEYLERFVEAWVRRYHNRIKYWEILNEPRVHHKGLTVAEYAEKILRPSYRIIKAIDPQAFVLPCAYNNLPVVGNKEEFWDLARGSYDIGNYHQYADWGRFRGEPTGERDEREVREFRAEMDKHGERDKPFWLTEIGFWGTGSLAGIASAGQHDPDLRGTFKPFYTGREYLDHPAVAREDSKRARWIKEVFPRVLAIRGCEKAFLWVSMDEFEGGWKPDALYGRPMEGRKVGQVDLWGIIAGDRQWRTSAYALQEMLKQEVEQK